LKPTPTSQKLRGGYYTPKRVATFLARWAIQSPKAEVLEPSCGDGTLLEAAAETLIEEGADRSAIARLLHGVEIDHDEAEKAEQRIKALKIPSLPDQIYRGDFFAYCQQHLMGQRLFNVVLEEGRRFDAVIGNPPFIRYQNFPEKSRASALEIMRQAGLHPNRLTNSWVPFLIASTLLLKDGGRLAMVIPAELFQVSYAAETRQFLSDYYNKITLVTFQTLVFEEIQQEVVLLLGERNSSETTGIRTIELEGLEALASFTYPDFSNTELKPMDHSSEKWTQYFLNTEEILFLRSMRYNPTLTLSGQVIAVDVGVVTGENKFFILTQQQADELGVTAYTQKVVSRSAHLKGAIFSHADWTANCEQQVPSLLFNPPPRLTEPLSESARQYIALGEEQGYNRGYKCSIRNPWYAVPSVWTPDAFMLRQVHGYPKLILNQTDATCTDTVHRVRFVGSPDRKVITSAFLNSLTFAFAEVTGRSYGGGVLTFEPTEAENLPLPLANAHQLDLIQLDCLLRQGEIEKVLDITDQVLLREGLGLSYKETRMLRGIWEKLRDRRINRKHKSRE
jgi:adenine-specific DNA-methyltransferase